MTVLRIHKRIFLFLIRMTKKTLRRGEKDSPRLPSPWGEEHNELVGCTIVGFTEKVHFVLNTIDIYLPAWTGGSIVGLGEFGKPGRNPFSPLNMAYQEVRYEGRFKGIKEVFFAGSECK